MTATPNSRVLSVKDLIDYQEGSIVSKVVLRSDAGNMTMFAFDMGQELSEHSAPYDALVQVLDGEVEIRISGMHYLVKSGEMIIMPANDPHAVLAVKKFKMLLTMIKA